MPSAWMLGYSADIIDAVEDVGTIPVLLRTSSHSESVLTPVPLGP